MADSFTDILKDVLPFLGTALGGPLGGAAASFLGSKLGIPDATVATITNTLQGMTPQALADLKVHDQEFQAKMAELGYDNIYKLAALTAQAQSDVNKTMQVESTSEHWPSYSWRPFIGFMFGSYIASMWILPLFHVTPVSLSPDLVISVGGILGVASYFRGKAQADPTVQNTPVTSQRG